MVLWSPPDATPMPAEYSALLATFETGLHEVLGDELASFYLYGAIAFPRPEHWALDVDFHVLLRRSLTDTERDGLLALHRGLAERSTLGRELDGYYLLLADADGHVPPRGQGGVFPSKPGELADDPVDEGWALHRAHVLADRFLLVFGDDPRTILRPPSREDLGTALGLVMAYVETHPEHGAFGLLSACRVLFSVRIHDVVVSKYDAARWALDEFPHWREPIEAAVRSYVGTATDADAVTLAEGWPEVVRVAREQLASW